DAGLGGGVIRLADIAHPAGRGNIHDAATAGRAHEPAGSPGHEKHAGQIHGNDLLPLLVRHLVEHGVSVDARVVDQNVKPVKTSLNVVDERIARARVRHVEPGTNGAV